MNELIPKECDWGDWKSDIDMSFAHETYCGRSNEEMQVRFILAPVESAGELESMPAVPFQYYVIGFSDSVMSRKHDIFVIADAASCFLRLVLRKLEKCRKDIIPVISSLMPAIEYVASHQKEFDADVDIYGDFYELLEKIKIEIVKN